MKLMQWLKRDRSNRRCSDSQVAMVTSPYSDDYGRNNSLNGADAGRTKEYLQALSEFRARRSLGFNFNFEKNFASPDRNKSLNNEERRSKSEQKPKRKSLPERCSNTQILSQTLPQIQFLFSNQIFMPGNKNQTKKRNRKQKVSDKNLTNQNSSPNFPQLNNNLDFDADDSESPSSPPANFFKDNSLPYMDKEATMPIDTSNSSSRDTPIKILNHSRRSSGGETCESQKPLLNSTKSDIYETIRRLSGSSFNCGKLIKSVADDQSDGTADLADTSIESVTRKLEEKCPTRSRMSSKRNFRGVPVVKRSTLKIASGGGRSRQQQQRYTGEGLARAHWGAVPVTLRGTLDVEYTSRDIDILSSVHHPNILLLMGITYDNNHRIECIFEECTTTLHDLMYEQKFHLPLNLCIEYLSDIANAASHLFDQGFIHTAISSHTIIITCKGVAKLFGFELYSKLIQSKGGMTKTKRSKCEPYKIIFSSPEPEYENLKGRLRHNDSTEKDLNVDSECEYTCTPQNIDERELLTHFRWQAPELFDDMDKKVTPTKTTDVYSICLVLWECFNGVIPWKSLSYKHLSDLYLLWQTGIRLKEGRYPVLIHDILSEGLSLDPEDRMTIRDLSAKLMHIKSYIHLGGEPYNTDLLEFLNTNPDFNRPEGKIKDELKGNHEKEQATTSHDAVHEKNDNDPQVTNIDGMDNSFELQDNKPMLTLNMSALRLDESRESDDLDISEATSYEPDDVVMNKTDSTEYCSLLTPDVRKFASRLQDPNNSMQPTKLDFEKSLREVVENNLQDKIKRLNSNFTPKSYKPLEIKTPPVENFQDLSKLTERIGSAEADKRGTYHFDVKNTSLPNTPIARNTKIRKYAWLTGEDDGEPKEEKTKTVETNTQYVQTDSIDFGKPQEENNVMENSYPDNELSKEYSNDSKHLEETLPLEDDGEVQVNEYDSHSLHEDLNALCTDRNPFRRSFMNNSRSLGASLSDKFRSRSQSWSSKCQMSSQLRGSETNIMGVDIKPLVAIHERWIEEAKQKHNKSLSLPDNYRGSAHAVKPASHRVDPVLPYSPNLQSHSFLTTKKGFKKRSPLKGPYQSIPNPIRPAVAKTMTVIPTPDDFFENSLWRKEKEKCQVLKSNPQSSSTPYKAVNKSTTQLDQATNTETFEELCEAIIQQMKIQGICNIFDQTDGRMSPTFDVTLQKNEISKQETINKTNKSLLIEQCEDVENKCITSLVNQTNLESAQNVPTQACKNMKHGEHLNQDEDSHSLPEIRNEIINKTLKRCQAFSALQSARSTEDMYIDDELCANNDIHALSDNMLFIPMHSSYHEALCDKANNCCLVKIKEESSNETILIVCDNSQKNYTRPTSSCSNTSESEYDANEMEFNRFKNLKIETLPSMSLVDMCPTPQALSVIEEMPGEEESHDSDNRNSKNIQQLISLYENANQCKNANRYDTPKNRSPDNRANEISFLILDNLEECDEDLSDNCDMKSNNEIFSTDNAIQDYISI